MPKKNPATTKVTLDETKLPRRPGHVTSRNRSHKREWEPSPLQLAVYEAVRKGGSYRTVATAFTEVGTKMSFQLVHQTCQRIDQYLALHYMDNIREIRARHTGHLEHIFCEAMAAFEKSKEIGVTEEFEEVTVETISPSGEEQSVPATKTKRKEVHQCGNSGFLAEARNALADIRKIHAADKNPRMVDINEGEDDERVAGKDRTQVIDEHIQRLQAAKKAIQVVTGSGQKAEQAG